MSDKYIIRPRAFTTPYTGEDGQPSMDPANGIKAALADLAGQDRARMIGAAEWLNDNAVFRLLPD